MKVPFRPGPLGPRLAAARHRATAALLAARTPAGHWVGELSSSALSTATAVTALAVTAQHSSLPIPRAALEHGLRWLVRHANGDGGWGTPRLA